jgi:hypothetical protein
VISARESEQLFAVAVLIRRLASATASRPRSQHESSGKAHGVALAVVRVVLLRAGIPSLQIQPYLRRDVASRKWDCVSSHW